VLDLLDETDTSVAVDSALEEMTVEELPSVVGLGLI
jgi:hypothetical protein